MVMRLALLCSLLVACGDDAQPAIDAAPPTPDGGTGAPCDDPPGYTEDISACQHEATDYTPAADDTWPACISDDNSYHQIEMTVSTIGRVEAFEDIAALLWTGDRKPSTEDFIDARLIYAQEQGLDSRVQRRHDVHYPPPEGGMTCADPGVPEMYPDRCVGPAKLLPILNDAFAAGATDGVARVEAARIEAALLWFLYVSALSEVDSCANTPNNCDSAWAYYTGGTPRDMPIGLARYVRALAPGTHDWAYDAILGVRCWRNLDNETGPAMDLALRDQVLAQLDRALLRGVAIIVRQRLAELSCTTGDVREARQAFLDVILPLLDRAARERDPALADQLMAGDPDDAIAALDVLFACP